MTSMGLESGLREDLAGTMADRLDAHLLGAGSADVRGFLATAAQGGIADYADPEHPEGLHGERQHPCGIGQRPARHPCQARRGGRDISRGSHLGRDPVHSGRGRECRQGPQVQITAVALHNFNVLRPDGFVRTKVKLA